MESETEWKKIMLVLYHHILPFQIYCRNINNIYLIKFTVWIWMS